MLGISLEILSKSFLSFVASVTAVGKPWDTSLEKDGPDKILIDLKGIISLNTSVKYLDEVISIPLEQIMIWCSLLCKEGSLITSLIFCVGKVMNKYFTFLISFKVEVPETLSLKELYFNFGFNLCSFIDLTIFWSLE